MGLFQGLLCLIWDLNLGNPGLSVPNSDPRTPLPLRTKNIPHRGPSEPSQIPKHPHLSHSLSLPRHSQILRL